MRNRASRAPPSPSTPRSPSRRSCCSRSRATATSTRAAGARPAPRAATAPRPRWRLALWWAGILALALALVSPIDRLGEQLATAHMVQHLLLADVVPICFTLALTKWILRPVTRHVHRIERAAGPFGAPGVRRRRLRRRDVAVARARALRRGARARRDPRARAPLLRRRRAPVLVAPAVADPLADAPGRDRADPLHGLDEDPRRLPRRAAHVLPDASSTTSTRPAARAGACRRSTTSTSRAWRWRSSSRS